MLHFLSYLGLIANSVLMFLMALLIVKVSVLVCVVGGIVWVFKKLFGKA